MSDRLSGAYKVLFDEIKEVRGDLRGMDERLTTKIEKVDRRLTRMEVKSGLIGAIAGAMVFGMTKIKMFFGGT